MKRKKRGPPQAVGRKPGVRNKSGHLGVFRRGQRWIAKLGSVRLGSFVRFRDAVAARNRAVREAHKAWKDAQPRPRPEPERRENDASGVPGVIWDPAYERWFACAIGDHWGRYLTVQEAVDAIAQYKQRNRGQVLAGRESVRRTGKHGTEDLTLEIARARLCSSGRFATEAEAEAALLAGPVRTTFCVYEMLCPDPG